MAESDTPSSTPVSVEPNTADLTTLATGGKRAEIPETPEQERNRKKNVRIFQVLPLILSALLAGLVLFGAFSAGNGSGGAGESVSTLVAAGLCIFIVAAAFLFGGFAIALVWKRTSPALYALLGVGMSAALVVALVCIVFAGCLVLVGSGSFH